MKWITVLATNSRLLHNSGSLLSTHCCWHEHLNNFSLKQEGCEVHIISHFNSKMATHPGVCGIIPPTHTDGFNGHSERLRDINLKILPTICLYLFKRFRHLSVGLEERWEETGLAIESLVGNGGLQRVYKDVLQIVVSDQWTSDQVLIFS